MQFDSFRTLKAWTLDEAADVMRVPGDASLAGINAAIISRHERGVAFPSPEHVARYEQITDGAVTYGDWVAIRNAAKDTADGRLPSRQRGRRSKEATV